MENNNKGTRKSPRAPPSPSTTVAPRRRAIRVSTVHNLTTSRKRLHFWHLLQAAQHCHAERRTRSHAPIPSMVKTVAFEGASVATNAQRNPFQPCSQGVLEWKHFPKLLRKFLRCTILVVKRLRKQPVAMPLTPPSLSNLEAEQTCLHEIGDRFEQTDVPERNW